MRDLNEEDNIIQQLIADDNSVIKSQYQKYRAGSLFSLKKLGANTADAEDIYQEAFVSFIINVKRGKFRGDSKLSTYINTIAKYKFYNLTKKQKIRTEDISEMNIDMEDKDDSAYSSELMDKMVQKLEALDDKCKLLLRSFYFKGLDLKTISVEMDISYDFIRQKRIRCISKLKDSMTKS